MMEELVVLSERPEDQLKAVEWVQFGYTRNVTV